MGVMRGVPERQLSMSSLSTEDLIPSDHPIRRIRVVVDEVLAGMGAEFDGMHAAAGRRSVPPETLLKATVLMAMYSIRSERAFCERLNYDMLFKWFLDLAIDERAFDPTTFTKNRVRLLEHEIADRFFVAVVAQAKLRRYTSSRARNGRTRRTRRRRIPRRCCSASRTTPRRSCRTWGIC